MVTDLKQLQLYISTVIRVPDLLIASVAAIAPRSEEEVVAKEPRKEAIGVLTPLTM